MAATGISNPKVTWATIVLLGFYSGGLTTQIYTNSTTNDTQWRYINKANDKIEIVDKYVNRFDNVISDIADNREAYKAMITAVNDLTVAVGTWKQQEIRAKEDRVKTEKFMMQMSKEIGDIKVKVTRIEALQTKDR